MISSQTGRTTMETVSKDLDTAVSNFYHKHKDIDNNIASKRYDPKEWTLKEIIGHLVNSACNNHQRFIGLQFVSEMKFPEYQKFHLDWLEREQFNAMNYADLVLLWRQYNIFMAHLIENVDKSKLGNSFVNIDKTQTLKELILDYVNHLKGHLKQFEETLQQAGK
jgi:hypothetical protein